MKGHGALEKADGDAVAKTHGLRIDHGAVRIGNPVYRTDSQLSGRYCGIFGGILPVYPADAGHAV